MAKISDTELQSIINGEISNALGFLGGNLSSQRKKSVEYYLGEKLGTEIDGRSQVVSTDVADTIETILPNLLRIFTASDQVVRCEPVKAEDVALAEQATNYINYVFNKDNPGFSILYTWFKDALLEKNGIVKVFWDESQKVEQETYRNLNENEYQLLVNDENVEFVETESFVDENAKEQIDQAKQLAEAQGQEIGEIPVPKLYNCIIKRTNATGKVKVENVPPEEFLISRSSKSIEDASFVLDRKILMEMVFQIIGTLIPPIPTEITMVMELQSLEKFV